MKPVDRFQALIRHPDYRSDPRLQGRSRFDWDQYDLPGLMAKSGPFGHWNEEWWRGKCEYERFLGIWGLTHAVDPKNHEKVEVELNALRAGDVSIFKDDLRGHDGSEDYGNPDSDQGHFFSIIVDLEQPTGELLELIRKMIDTKRRERGIRTKRTKPRGVDPWDVWDKMQVPGNTLLKIARALFNVKGNPAYDEETKKAYDQVQRANRKAVSLIEEVGMRRNKPDTEETIEAAWAVFAPDMKEILSRHAARFTSDFNAAEKRDVRHKA